MQEPRAVEEIAFAPSAVRVVELGEPLQGFVAEAMAAKTPYRDVVVLVRLHGQPLGLVTLPLVKGELAVDDLATALWSAVGTRVERHVRRHGCISSDAVSRDALGRGLAADSGCAGAAPVLPARPSVSVVVATAGRAATLEQSLADMRALRYPDYDVIVVDNRPTDRSTYEVVEKAARQDPRVRYVAEPRPGNSVARNTGICHSRAELVAFTDDDVSVDHDWLGWLVEPFVGDPAVDAVTGLVLPAELETQAQWWFEAYGGFSKGFDRRVYDLNENRADDRILYPFWGGAFGSGNSMAFRRSALAAIGGFDPALGSGSPARGGGDIEAFSHVILRGGRLVYEPRAICWHVHRRDEVALRRQLFYYGVGFTAILTKWMLRDRRASAALARALVRVARERLGGAPSDLRRRPNFPAELDRVELRGYLLGPLLYLQSVFAARRRGLHAGRPGGD